MAAPARNFPNKFAVVGIDLGTTYSGIAFITEQAPALVTASAPGATLPQVKEPTVLVETTDATTNRSKWLFGNHAVQHYRDNATDDEDEVADVKLYKLFKLGLLNAERRDFLEHIFDAYNTDSSESLLQLYSQSLSCLKDHALTEIRNQTGTAVPASNVFWVLTVPARTSEYCKSFMREAAKIAGLIAERNSSDLTFLLEPEAAAIALAYGDQTGNFTLGKKFILVDCGGGTVDVTSHEVVGVSPLSLTSLTMCGSGQCGSEKVNKGFELWLQERLSRLPATAIEEIRTRPGCKLAVELEFDAIKLTFRSNTDEISYISLRNLLDSKENMAAFDQVIRDYNASVAENLRVTFQPRNGNFRISRGLMMSFFQPLLDETIRITREVRVGCRTGGHDINSIVVVGGFATSDILQTSLREAFPGETVIFPTTPLHPQSAIVVGAARFGAAQRPHNPGPDPIPPNIIENRIATMTIAVFFEPNSLRPLVRIGESVPVNTFKELVGFPVNVTQTQCQWKLYTSNLPNPETTAGATLLGSVTIDIPQVGGIADREMKTKFTFGDGEIAVFIEFPRQGRQHRGAIAFDHL